MVWAVWGVLPAGVAHKPVILINATDDVSQSTLEAFQGFKIYMLGVWIDIQVYAKIAILLPFKLKSVIWGLVLIKYSSYKLIWIHAIGNIYQGNL